MVKNMDRNLNDLIVIPTYKVVSEECINSGDEYIITLVNTRNDFDVINIQVPTSVWLYLEYDNYYTIYTRVKRTWYTLWLGKKKKYEILGNVDRDKVLVVKANDKQTLSKKDIESIQREWYMHRVSEESK